MRKRILKLAKKVRYRWSAFYTWLWRSSLKRCGKNVRFDFPIRLEEPGSITVGSNVVIYPRAWLNPVSEWAGAKYAGEITLGDRVMIGYGVQISAAMSVVVEDDAVVSMGVVIVDHIHDHRHIDTTIFAAPLSKPSPVRIGRSAFLGVYSLIGPGVQIGEHAVVAANAVVTKDVPPFCIAIGSPARITRFHDPEAARLSSGDLTGVERG
jgi:acetyltransferase-like isoleucine patch superfamily enzyme